MIESNKIRGHVYRTIEYRNGDKQIIDYPNAITLRGRYALAKALTNQIQGGFNYYITKMLFGNGGTVGGVPRFVHVEQNGLFGLQVLSKPVVSSIDISMPQQAIFTSVIAFDEAVSQTLNEMALQMANNDIFSMATFADLNKTSDMQITYNWKILFI